MDTIYIECINYENRSEPIILYKLENGGHKGYRITVDQGWVEDTSRAYGVYFDLCHGEGDWGGFSENELEEKIAGFLRYRKKDDAERANKIARAAGFLRADYLTIWNGYRVFEPIVAEDGEAWNVGGALILITNREGRWTTGDEWQRYNQEADIEDL